MGKSQDGFVEGAVHICEPAVWRPPDVCNNYKLEVPASQLAMAFEESLQYPGGVPNLEPRADIRIGDTAPVVVRGEDGLELKMTQWAWRSPQGRPVFNFRSEGRDFPALAAA